MDTPDPNPLVEAQHTLSADAQRYRDYAEMSSDWYWEQDGEFRFTYFSREFEEITGVPSAKGLGRTRWEGLGRERLGNVDWPAHQKLLQAHLPFRNFEYPTMRPDGRMIWFRVSGKPRLDMDGQFLGYFGIAADISATRNLQSQLQQAERLAAVGQLAAGMAHEINNPIGFVCSNVRTLGGYLEGLLALADACAAQPNLPETLKHALREADVEFVRQDTPQLVHECREGLERVRKIVADLREFAHEGRSEWLMADLHTCIASAINLVSCRLPSGVSMECAGAKLPAVHCCPAQINQVLLALLTNAIQASERKTGPITVRTGQADAEHVWFEVADQGCGIAPENLPHLFEPFFTTREVGRGTGMGLATVFGMVSDHGGSIDVDSSLGSGSRFRVTLPVKRSG